MNYKIFGTGDNLIVFLHGFGGGFESFYQTACELSKRYKCLLISFFDSEPDHPLELKDYCEYVERVIDGVECERVTLVGHSFGGRVAISLAANQMCDKLVLVDSAGLRPRRKLSYYTRVAIYKVKKALGMDISRYGSADYRTLSGIMRKTFVNIVNTYQDSSLASIRIPTLIIWGDEDGETPLYMAKKLNNEIKDSSLVIYPHTGHFAYLEENQRFIRNLRGFIG